MDGVARLVIRYRLLHVNKNPVMMPLCCASKKKDPTCSPYLNQMGPGIQSLVNDIKHYYKIRISFSVTKLLDVAWPDNI